MIRANPPYNGERVTVEYTTTDEILEFIVKYEGILQTLVIQNDLAHARAHELVTQTRDMKEILEEAYAKLRIHLGNKATRMRHT
jgi:hypothetical protein